MGFTPPGDDFFKWIQEILKRLQRLERVSRSHTETKTFLVNGLLDPDTYIPRGTLNLNPLDGAPETKRIISTHCDLFEGEIELSFSLNGVEFMVHTVTTTHTVETLTGDPVYIPANGASRLQIAVVSGAGTHLSAGVTILTTR